MAVSRRTMLKTAAAGVVAAAVGGEVGVLALRASAQETAAGVAGGTGAAGTTLAKTVLPGSANGLGYRTLVAGPGEPYVQTAMYPPHASFETNPTVVLAAFGHLSDLHVVDDQSPLRVEFLDHLADSGSPHFGSWPTGSAYRPHEFLSTQIVDAMASSLRSIGNGPATNTPLAFTIVTGDAVDNAQFNETRWYIDLLDGSRQIVPNSGDLTRSESVGDLVGAPVAPSDSYWYPNNAHSSVYRQNFGYPAVSGLMAAARRPFTSTGLGMPWYAVYGNHDAMVQGNARIDTDFHASAVDLWSIVFPLFIIPTGFNPTGLPPVAEMAVGNRKPVNVSSVLGQLPANFADVGFVTGAQVLLSGTVDTAPVTPDDRRRLLSRKQFVAEHFNTPASPGPVGHGFASATSGIAYYVIPASGLVNYIVLDSVNADGDLTNLESNASGCIDDVQFKWLEDRLIERSSRYLDAAGNLVSHSAANKLIVIACHHTIDTMTNLHGDGKHSGKELETLLLRFPNVILMVNGHTHRNQIAEHVRSHKALDVFGFGGFFEVSAASHIDWPMQGRTHEIAVGGSTISIFTTVFDLDAPLSYGGDLSSPRALASLARELGVNDPQERLNADGSPVDMTAGRRGAVPDWRNSQLLLPAPFSISNGLRTFVGSAGTLQVLDVNGVQRNTGIAVRSNTSPAIASSSNGGWFVTAQDTSGHLAQMTETGAPVTTPWVLKSGTSPAIVRTTSDGLYKMAFVGSSGELLVIDSNGASVGTGFLPDATPAIAVDAGTGWKVAFNGVTTNHLVTYDAAGTVVDTKWIMAPGTSPAIAALAGGGHQMVIHSSDGFVTQVNPDGSGRHAGNGLGIAPGTSPSIAADRTGGWMLAFHASTTDHLWTVDHLQNQREFANLTVAAGTSPVIVAAQGDGYEISFQAADGRLCTLDSAGNPHPTTLRVAPGSGPAAASVANVVLPPPPPPPQIKVPDVRETTFKAARKELNDLGLFIGLSGQSVPDDDCTKFAKQMIATQQPGPEAPPVSTGTTVLVGLYVAPPGGCP